MTGMGDLSNLTISREFREVTAFADDVFCTMARGATVVLSAEFRIGRSMAGHRGVRR
jgi:hypothetical protein